MLTTQIHLVPRLRMSGAIVLLLLYAFMVWKGKALVLYCWYWWLISDYVQCISFQSNSVPHA